MFNGEGHAPVPIRQQIQGSTNQNTALHFSCLLRPSCSRLIQPFILGNKNFSGKETQKKEISKTAKVTPPNSQAEVMPAFKNETVTKPSKDCRVGIKFGTNTNDELIISKIASDGLFANSGLESNMHVLGINGVQITKNMTAAQAAQLVKDAESSVTVRAVKRTPAPATQQKAKKIASSAGSPTTSLPVATRVTARIPHPPPPGCPEGGYW